ncbi:hypothetical protein EMQ25_17415 [Arsenicitalea aurantiaca]|uniref:M20/M25/M40 family metallo-hydrolase n=1 Tax=Arsenicitalea aurantiaca TaxID=1783274 RepID=A0A433X2Q9_9HYPH|nr:M20/M25/M40 family metallo-hydrolase [Arsenicitalea aurantiaca]RUT28361.1 hypothetical protein EMQ25_17415 [Arsenicitalea aurantiaca]
MRDAVEGSITTDLVRTLLKEISERPAPSSAASAFRGPVLRDLLKRTAPDIEGLELTLDLAGTGSAAILTGTGRTKPLWYLAHLDTISYLVHPEAGGRYPLVPYCYHLMEDGRRPGSAWRFDFAKADHVMAARGEIVSEAGNAFFVPADPATRLGAGDRVVFDIDYEEQPDGTCFGHVDNAGGVAALMAAAPVLAGLGIDALLAFPDEEEGPAGSGSQTIGRGGSRIAHALEKPELAIVVDVQQGGGEADADSRGGPENTVRLGSGAVLCEFSSLGRGSVTPPHLYALLREFAAMANGEGVKVQISNNAYTSRSDDISVMLHTPNVALLGFAGFNRHCDRGLPRANIHDITDLAKSLVYAAALRPVFNDLNRMLLDR